MADPRHPGRGQPHSWPAAPGPRPLAERALAKLRDLCSPREKHPAQPCPPGSSVRLIARACSFAGGWTPLCSCPATGQTPQVHVRDRRGSSPRPFAASRHLARSRLPQREHVVMGDSQAPARRLIRVPSPEGPRCIQRCRGFFPGYPLPLAEHLPWCRMIAPLPAVRPARRNGLCAGGSRSPCSHQFFPQVSSSPVFGRPRFRRGPLAVSGAATGICYHENHDGPPVRPDHNSETTTRSHPQHETRICRSAVDSGRKGLSAIWPADRNAGFIIGTKTGSSENSEMTADRLA